MRRTAPLRSRHLEAARNFDAVYDLMHPDAQAIIPRAAVVGWYGDFLADQEAGVLDSHRRFDRFLAVACHRPDLRSDRRSVVRPALHAKRRHLERTGNRAPGRSGRWPRSALVFGRSREFVDEQIALYGGSENVAQTGTGEYEIVELGVLPGLDISSADAINNQGLVAGTCYVRLNPGYAGFVWENGVMQALAAGAPVSPAISISQGCKQQRGDRWRELEFEGASTAFRIEGTSFEDIGTIEIESVPSQPRLMIAARLSGGPKGRNLAILLGCLPVRSSGLTMESHSLVTTMRQRAMLLALITLAMSSATSPGLNQVRRWSGSKAN